MSKKSKRKLCFILIVTLFLRLFWVLIVDTSPDLEGGDGPFYLHLGDQLARGLGLTYGEPIAVVGPVYPLYLAFVQILFGVEDVILVARVGQAFMGVGFSLLMFDLGRRWVGTEVGLVAAGLIALDLRFIVESGSISTETLLSFLLLINIWLYMLAIERNTRKWWVIFGVVLGITTLTRGVVQYLPVVFVFVMFFQRNRINIWKSCLLFLTGFIMVVLPWVIRNWIIFGNPTIAHGGAAHFWMGAQGDGRSLRKYEMMDEINDLRIGDGGADRYRYVEDAFDIIMNDPVGFLSLRSVRLAEAYMQPFGTVSVGEVFGTTSIKNLVFDDSRSTLQEIFRQPSLLPKLWIYCFHFGSILASFFYMYKERHLVVVWMIFPIIIFYFTIVYSLLTIIPRYIFPVMSLYLLMSACIFRVLGKHIYSLLKN